MIDDRCGHEFALGDDPSGGTRACCWRPVWRDTDRCKWHLDRDKSDVLLQPLRIDDDAFLQEAVFRGAKLAGETELSERDLQRSDFTDADLRDADLSRADLRDATFAGADLRAADLSGADLRDADLSEADLRDADLADADARGSTFERANLERASLIRTNLRDSSIKDAYIYEVLFSDTWINEGTELGWQCIYESDEDLELDRDQHDIQRLEGAAWSYRALEQLCRENALPSRTRWFYIREKDARRKQAWAASDYTSALKSEVSRWVMEYGSNPWRIVAVSLLVIVFWAILYPLTGGLQDTATSNAVGVWVETPADAPRYYMTTVFLKSLYFSVITFATLGYGDIVPIGGLARALATVETMLGSMLTALLVFVLSRVVTW